TINPVPGIQGIVIGSVCEGSTSTNLNYTSTIGSPDEYSIDFLPGSEAVGFTDVPATAFPASPITLAIPGGAPAGTYYAELIVTNTSVGCPSASIPISITILANPTITLAGNPEVCIGETSAELSYSGVTGSPNQYSIDFDGAAEAAGFADVANTNLPASPITVAIPGSATAGTYNGTITVYNTSSGCESTT